MTVAAYNAFPHFRNVLNGISSSCILVIVFSEEEVRSVCAVSWSRVPSQENDHCRDELQHTGCFDGFNSVRPCAISMSSC